MADQTPGIKKAGLYVRTRSKSLIFVGSFTGQVKGTKTSPRNKISDFVIHHPKKSKYVHVKIANFQFLFSTVTSSNGNRSFERTFHFYCKYSSS